jgi:hypothetical protein
MEEENKEAQNSVETEAGQPQANEEKLDSFFGETKEEPQQTDKVDVAKEEKKQRDFEKAFFKERDENKKLKAEMESKNQNQPQPAEVPAEAEEGINLLKRVVGEAVEPYLGNLKEQQEKQIVSEFQKKEYVDILSNEIQGELKNIPESLPLNDRLEQARLMAIGKNADKIVEAALETGREAGYKNRSFKKAQGTIKETPASNYKDDFFKRLDSGNVSKEEYKERLDEVRKYEREQLNIN